MGKKSKRKNKKHKQKKDPPELQPPTPAAPRRRIRFLEGLTMFLALLGLITLVEMFPRLSATASAPTNPEDVLGQVRPK